VTQAYAVAVIRLGNIADRLHRHLSESSDQGYVGGYIAASAGYVTRRNDETVTNNTATTTIYTTYDAPEAAVARCDFLREGGEE